MRLLRLMCRRQELNLHGLLSPLGPEPSASSFQPCWTHVDSRCKLRNSSQLRPIHVAPTLYRRCSHIASPAPNLRGGCSVRKCFTFRESRPYPGRRSPKSCRFFLLFAWQKLFGRSGFAAGWGERAGLTHHNSETGSYGKVHILSKPRLLPFSFATFR